MKWIILILLLWFFLPFVNMIISFVAWLVKWVMIGICIIIDMFKK